jgi:hypothetical protein
LTMSELFPPTPCQPATSSVEDSPAKTSVLPAKGRASRTARVPAFGKSLPGSSASYDHSTRSWRTSAPSGGEDSIVFSGTWPRAGMTRSGTAFPRVPLAPLTGGTGSGLWPTPRAYSSGEGVNPPGLTTLDIRVRGLYLDRPQGERYHPKTSTRSSSALIPTPTVNDSRNGANATATRASATSKHHSGTTLVDYVRMWPTPCAGDARGAGPNQHTSSLGRSIKRELGGQLNPLWVEWLRGYPAGWTDSAAWATPSSRKSRKSLAK